MRVQIAVHHEGSLNQGSETYIMESRDLGVKQNLTSAVHSMKWLLVNLIHYALKKSESNDVN